MSAHTPAPWEWSGRWLCGKGKMILWYTTNDDGIHAEPEDARLIAAAPMMFEEIEREYTELADIRNQWEGRHTLEGQQKLCRLRDLICLVTGRDQMDVQDDYGNRLMRATGEQP